MYDSYTTSAQSAREGDTSSQRITESGAYIGTITLAEAVTAGTGAKGIELSFESTDKQTANYLTMYTRNKDGQYIYGEKQLNALLVCMRVKGITPQQMTVKKYDFDLKQEVEQLVTAYPEMMKKPIGLVLQKEQYEKKSGGIGERMSLFSFFDPETRKTAIEILDDKPAKKLDSILASLKDKTISASQPQAQPMSENPAHGMDDDEDFPF